MIVCHSHWLVVEVFSGRDVVAVYWCKDLSAADADSVWPKGLTWDKSDGAENREEC